MYGSLAVVKYQLIGVCVCVCDVGGGVSARQKVAFYVGLTENLGPVSEHSDIVFDRVITNVGGAYEPRTGRFTAPLSAVYQFNVIISAQGRHKVITMRRFTLCLFMVALWNRETIYIFMLWFVMVALCNRADHYIFILFLLSSFFFFFFFLA